jgi:hypothetical protein
MASLDATGRAYQNAPLFSEAIQGYETDHGGSCKDVVFDKLREPGQKVGEFESLYVIEGTSRECGRRAYRAKIVFKDPPQTVVKDVHILERTK